MAIWAELIDTAHRELHVVNTGCVEVDAVQPRSAAIRREPPNGRRRATTGTLRSECRAMEAEATREETGRGVTMPSGRTRHRDDHQSTSGTAAGKKRAPRKGRQAKPSGLAVPASTCCRERTEQASARGADPACKRLRVSSGRRARESALDPRRAPRGRHDESGVMIRALTPNADAGRMCARRRPTSCS